MNGLPTGTVTFLFTDIEGSTRIAQEHPDGWETLRARHHAILQHAMDEHRGYIFQIIGDGFCVAFATAMDALNAAIATQRLLQQETWEPAQLKVRMGLHTGAAEARTEDDRSGGYRGYVTLAHTQRVMSTASGGQILLSNATAELVRGELPQTMTLLDMHKHRLKGFLNPEHFWQLSAAGLQQTFPPIQSVDQIPNNLPIQVTSFIGRELEIARVKTLLATTRLLTFTGPGGVGKTRLSLQVAAEIIDQFKDGVWLVELAPLSDESLVSGTIANVLGLQEDPGRPFMVTLIEWLRNKNALIILDNCEHVIAAAANFAEQALHASSLVTILASSREALGIQGETSYQVLPLETPTHKPYSQTSLDTLAQFPAVQLFIERVSKTLVDFNLTDENATAVAEICQRLDGIPLAIELAAARVKALPVEQIAARLSDRFKLLVGGSRTALPRQQTLQALIDWSYDLLTEPERLLFQRLGVFVGGWTLEAAEAVCTGNGIESFEILDLLFHMVDKSLVMANIRSDEGRYEFLETIRQYSLLKLTNFHEEESLRKRHLGYYIELIERAESEFHKPEQKKWLAKIKSEHDNLRSVLEWSLEHHPDACLQLCSGLSDYWDTLGYITEGRSWLNKSLQATQAALTTPIRVKALYGAAGLAGRQGNIAECQKQIEEGLSISKLLSYERGIAQGFTFKGFLPEVLGTNLEEAWVMQDDALKLWRGLEDRLGIGQAIGPVANRAYNQCNYQQAENLYRESLALFREIGDEKETAGALYNLAEVALAQGNFEQARSLAAESLALYQALDDRHGIATLLRILGESIDVTDAALESVGQYQESIRIFRELDDLGCLAVTLCSLGETYYKQGQLQEASALGEEGLSISQKIEYRPAIVRAYELLGRSVLSQGQTREAHNYLSLALKMQNITDKRSIASLLEGLASLWKIESRLEKAVELMSASARLRKSIQLPLSPENRKLFEHDLELLRNSLQIGLFEAAWARGEEFSLEEAVELALTES